MKINFPKDNTCFLISAVSQSKEIFGWVGDVWNDIKRRNTSGLQKYVDP